MNYLILGKKMVVLWVLIMLVNQIGMGTAKSQLASRPNHIFLSFRGTDTRETFASLTYDALIREGMNVFMDDESMRTGHDIELTIREAIDNSVGAVIIFSNDFASSRWCLDELIRILRLKRELGSDYVLAVIYVEGVEPDDINGKRGSYGDALEKHENKCWFWMWNCKKEVNVWRAALTEVTGYRGWILRGNRKWSNFINEVVKEIRLEFTMQGITVIPRGPFLTGMDEFIKMVAKFIILLVVLPVVVIGLAIICEGQKVKGRKGRG